MQQQTPQSIVANGSENGQTCNEHSMVKTKAKTIPQTVEKVNITPLAAVYQLYHSAWNIGTFIATQVASHVQGANTNNGYCTNLSVMCGTGTSLEAT